MKAAWPVALATAIQLILGCAADPSWQETKARIRGTFPDVPQLAVEDLGAWLADPRREPPLLVDVRTAEEHAVSHLPGARRVDPDGSAKQLADTPHDRPIVTYCAVGYRSSAFAERLIEEGYSRVWNLEGSIFEWANSGHPVVRGEDSAREVPVSEVHPFGDRWGLLLSEELRSQ